MRLFLIFIFLFCIRLSAQISPGDLTKAHANLEGISSCTICHEIGERVKNSNCLDCHTEVHELMKTGRGYHSSGEVKGKNCSGCHSEHHGRDFRIVNFKSEEFDHSKTTFPLLGRHKNIKCSDCHYPMNIVIPEAAKKNADWMGLSASCRNCHEDYHQSSLGNDCKSCHDTEHFRPSLFSHEKSKFILSGSHIRTDCVKCHPKEKKNGKEFQKFKGIMFSSCESCHRDIHNGKFGKECKNCHNTNSFRSINQNQFDHSRTDFPLLGKHLTVSCRDCHKNSMTEKLKHEKCLDCHSDYHKGGLTANNILRDCSECHSESGFVPSFYSLEQHNKTVFPLTGSHLAVPCISCHFKENAWKFKNIGIECIDCHKNIHNNEISEKFYTGESCRNCHSINKWNTISFDHNKTGFILAGKHSEIKCRDCHTRENDPERQRFKSLEDNCTECHYDIHEGQFGAGSFDDCSRCHTFNNWKPDKFDHAGTKFNIEGAHSRLKCSECHKTATAGNKTFIKYKLEDFRCASCHS